MPRATEFEPGISRIDSIHQASTSRASPPLATTASVKTSSDARVREFYEDSAGQYSEMMDREIDLPIYDEVLRRLAVRIAEVPGPVVDTSCGSGHMLARFRERYDSDRELVGIDLSPGMVAITSARLGSDARVLVGDMRRLADVEPSSTAAVLSFFALHHVTSEDALVALREWHRVLRPGGALVIATWEGAGAIDYAGQTDVVALRYSTDEVAGWARDAGFCVDRCVVAPVEDMSMNAVYLDASKLPGSGSSTT